MIKPKLATKTIFRKTTALLVALSFAFSNVAFADVPEDGLNLDAQKPKEIVTDPEKIVIPRDYGLIKSKYTGKDKRLVIHIQDAHCNYEAQTNITKILDALVKNDGLNLVSVEGADGFIDTSWFKAFPDADIRKEVADYFMKKGEITGPEFLSITTDLPIRLFGAETRAYYIENLNAFTSSYPLKEDTERYFNQIKAVLNKLKGYIYSEELKDFDAKSQDYESKKLSFTDYVKYLEMLSQKYKVNVRSYDNLFKLISVLVYEKKIDFSVVDKERASLIDAITKKLTKDQLTELVNKSLEFKVGKVASAEYYDYLRKLASKYGIALFEDYPNLFNYIIYNSVYSRIENEQLFNDIKKFEEALKDKIFTNDDQRTLDKLFRHINILIGLTNIKLLNGDFDYYKARKEEFSHEAFADFINKMASRFGFVYEVDAPSQAVTENMPRLEDFYAIAIKRDKALVDNTLQAMKKEGMPIAVLVTGGFHSEGITKLLEKEGVSYLVVCPNITKDVETPYIKILTNQRTPLEDILSDTVTTTADAKSATDGMLAPYSIVEAIMHKNMGRMMDELDAIAVGGEESIIAKYLAEWLPQARAGIEKKRLPFTPEMVHTCFKIAVDNAVDDYIRNSKVDAKEKKRIKENAKEIKEKLSMPVIERLLTAPVQDPTIFDRGLAYSSPKNFQAYVAVRMADLIKAIPGLEGLIKQYRSMPDGDEKTAFGKKIDAIITEKYNAPLINKTIGFEDSQLTDKNIIKDLPGLYLQKDFAKKQITDSDDYLEKVYNAISKGEVCKIDLWGGAASRLFGTGQKVDTKLSYAAHDVYDVAVSNKYITRDELLTGKFNYAIQGVSIMTRLMIQEWIDIEKIVEKYYSDKGIPLDVKDIQEKRGEIIWQMPRIIIINAESGESIVKEFVANNFYGYDPKKIVFVTQDVFRGYGIENGKAVLKDNTRPTPAGHGDSTIQITEPGRSFIVNKEGRVTTLKEDALTYAENIAKNKDLIFIESRVNDMLKLGFSLGKNPHLTIAETDLSLFAQALSLFAQGKNIVFEQVNQDPKYPIKGSSPIEVNGRRIAVETLGQSPAVAKLVTKEGTPFNRFYVYWKSAAFRLLKEQGLQVHFRFRDGYIYPETVTSDATMVNGVNAEWMLDPTRIITDYKDGKKTIEYGVRAALGQDNSRTFRAYLETLRQKAKDRSDVTIRGLDRAPGFAEKGVGAIDMAGADLTRVHGPRTLGTSAENLLSIENMAEDMSLNGAIAGRFLVTNASSFLDYVKTVKGDKDIKRWRRDYENSPGDVKDTIHSNIYVLTNLLQKMPSKKNLVLVKGLKRELESLKVAVDTAFHYGVTRNTVYIDEDDFMYLLSLKEDEDKGIMMGGAYIIMQGIEHEVAHIENELAHSKDPNVKLLTEDEIEANASTIAVRTAILAKLEQEIDTLNMELQTVGTSETRKKALKKRISPLGEKAERWTMALLRAQTIAELKKNDEIENKIENKTGTNMKFEGVKRIVIPEAELAIKRVFGTNGMRGGDITIDTQRRSAAATAEILKAQWQKANPGEELPWLMVGFDPRPQGVNGFNLNEMGESKAVAEVLAAYGFRVVFVPKAVAAPFMISMTGKDVHSKNVYASVMRTASHNEVVDPMSTAVIQLVSGTKLFIDNAPAPDSITGLISERMNDKELAKTVLALDFDKAAAAGRIVVVKDGDENDPDAIEFRRLSGAFDLAKIGESFRKKFPDLKIAMNTMNGGMSGFAPRVLKAMGFEEDKNFKMFNTKLMNDPSMKDKMTGWIEYTDPVTKEPKKVRFAPDPTRKWMRGKDYTDYVASDPAHIIALLIDGDADRLVAELEKEIIPNDIGMLAAYYLAKYKGQTGRIVRTVPTTGGLDALSKALGLGKVQVTPVGSKWFAGPNKYYDGTLNDILVAIEESGHIGFIKKNKSADKGELFFDHSIGLSTLMLEMMAETGKTWQELSDEMWAFIKEKTGQEKIAALRYGISKEEGAEKYYDLAIRLRNPGEDALRKEFGGRLEKELALSGFTWKVGSVDTTDLTGAQFQFKGGQRLFPRKSGTDGSLRLYVEVLDTERDKAPELVKIMRKVMDSFISQDKPAVKEIKPAVLAEALNEIIDHFGIMIRALGIKAKEEAAQKAVIENIDKTVLLDGSAKSAGVSKSDTLNNMAKVKLVKIEDAKQMKYDITLGFFNPLKWRNFIALQIASSKKPVAAEKMLLEKQEIILKAANVNAIIEKLAGLANKSVEDVISILKEENLFPKLVAAWQANAEASAAVVMNDIDVDVANTAKTLSIQENMVQKAVSESINKTMLLNDFAESVGIPVKDNIDKDGTVKKKGALTLMVEAGLAVLNQAEKAGYGLTQDFFNRKKLENFMVKLVVSSDNPKMVDLTLIRLQRIILNSIDVNKLVGQLAAGKEVTEVVKTLKKASLFPTLIATWDLANPAALRPDIAPTATEILTTADLVAPASASFYKANGINVEFILPDNTTVNSQQLAALKECQRVMAADMARGEYNYRGTGTKQTIEQFFNDYFMKEWYPKIRDFVNANFNEKEPLKAIVTDGIGANDQFMWSLVRMYNENRPAGAPKWYHIAMARDLIKLKEDGIDGKNALFINISRSGNTWEGVEVAIRSLGLNFYKEIAIANGGAIEAIALEAAKIGGYKSLVIGMSPDIGGRNMHRKTTIYYTALTVAGIFLPSMDSTKFAVLNHEFDKANDFLDPDKSLPLNMGKFLQGSMKLLGVEHIAFITDTEPLRLVGTEWEQYVMEGSNKEDVISMGIHDLANEPEFVLQNLASSPAGKLSIGIAILDISAQSYSQDIARVNAIKEKMPLMILTIDSAKALQEGFKGGISPAQQAAFDILWTDMVTALTTLLRVDANSNPNVKLVREYTATRVAKWKEAADTYKDDAIGKEEAEVLMSYGSPVESKIGSEGKQIVMTLDNAAAKGQELAKELLDKGLLKNHNRLNLFVGRNDLLDLVKGLRNDTYKSRLATEVGWITQTALFPLWSHKGLEANLAYSTNPDKPLLANKTLDIFFNARKAGSVDILKQKFDDLGIIVKGKRVYEGINGATIHQTNDAMTIPNIKRMAEVSPTILFEFDEKTENVEAIIKAFYAAFIDQLGEELADESKPEQKTDFIEAGEFSETEKAFEKPAAEIVNKELSKTNIAGEQAEKIKSSIMRESVGLFTTLNAATVSETPKEIVVLLRDTGLDPVSNGAAQAGSAAVNRYLDNSLIEVRGKGRSLLDNGLEQIAQLKAQGKTFKVVTIVGDATKDQIFDRERGDLGTILNIADNTGTYLPVIGLYDLAIRIAYGHSSDEIAAFLGRIATNPETGNPFTRDEVEQLLKSGFIRILPKMVPVNMTEAVEAYKAAESVLRAL